MGKLIPLNVKDEFELQKRTRRGRAFPMNYMDCNLSFFLSVLSGDPSAAFLFYVASAMRLKSQQYHQCSWANDIMHTTLSLKSMNNSDIYRQINCAKLKYSDYE